MKNLLISDKKNSKEYKNNIYGKQPLTLGLRQCKPKDSPSPQAEHQTLLKQVQPWLTRWQRIQRCCTRCLESALRCQGSIHGAVPYPKAFWEATEQVLGKKCMERCYTSKTYCKATELRAARSQLLSTTRARHCTLQEPAKGNKAESRKETLLQYLSSAFH